MKYFAQSTDSKTGRWFTFGFNLSLQDAADCVKNLCTLNGLPGRVVDVEGNVVSVNCYVKKEVKG